jgi:NADH-quinone oxidoreductase subunit E
MLSDEEIREVETELAQYPERQSACVGALKAVQRRRGWISDETLGDVAEVLGMSSAELDSVATFYPLLFRRRVGRHVIRVCDSVSCWILGSDGIGRALAVAIGIGPGETTADGRFTLLPTACLGVCERAPALMIDDDVHTHVDAAELDQILARYP